MFPWLLLFALMISLPWLAIVVSRVLSARSGRPRSVGLTVLIAALGVWTTIGFLGGLTIDSIPAAWVQADRLLDEVQLVSSYELVDHGPAGDHSAPYRRYGGPAVTWIRS
jgi:hypothetical protein